MMSIYVEIMSIVPEHNVAIVKVVANEVERIKLYPIPVWKTAYQRCIEITLLEIRNYLHKTDETYSDEANEFTPEQWDDIKAGVAGKEVKPNAA